jgi:hypothetical protein
MPEIREDRYWLITDKGDPEALALVDGRTDLLYHRNGYNVPHYSRQNPGTRSFTRNGQNLVFISTDKLAVWVTFRPTPGVAVPPDGFITYIRPELTTKRRSRNSPPGACYRHAGWKPTRPAADGKPCLRAPECMIRIPCWREWRFNGTRGGLLRRNLEGMVV